MRANPAPLYKEAPFPDPVCSLNYARKQAQSVRSSIG
jgi:hypothetical protein